MGSLCNEGIEFFCLVTAEGAFYVVDRTDEVCKLILEVEIVDLACEVSPGCTEQMGNGVEGV